MTRLPLRHRLLHDRAGTTSLEFAMAGLTLVILLLAVFDIGLLFLTKRSLDYAIDRAARWASVNSATASVATVLSQFQQAAGAGVQNASACQGYAAASGVPAGSSCALVVTFPSGATVGGLVTLQANYRWSPVSPVDGFAVIQLQSSVALTIQH